MLEKLFIVNIFLAVFAGFSCNTTEAPTNIPLTLTIEDVSCTEAWLKVNAENANGVLFITKDQSKTIFQITNPGNIDTIIYADSLLPNKSYTFQAILTENSKLIGTSEKMTGLLMIQHPIILRGKHILSAEAGKQALSTMLQ